MMTVKKSFVIVVCVLVHYLAYGQLDNNVFSNRSTIDSTKAKELSLRFHTLGFFKNNEYSNRIADGFTLFGYQLNPYLTYQASPSVRIDAGVYLQKDFGVGDFTEIAPYFRLKFTRGDFNIIFGNLEGNLNHGLIEPIYDFERVLNDRLENGIQGVWSNEEVFLDFWVNWERQIFKGDPFQEEISGGLSFNYALGISPNSDVLIPMQLFLYHQGGQIDTNPNPVTTLMNAAFGLGFETRRHDSFLSSIRSENYLVIYDDQSTELQQAYVDGYGIYLNLILKARNNLSLGFSYWNGDEFISPKGGQLFSSVSTSINSPGVLEEERELMIFRVFHDWEISKEFTFTTRVEPYYDFRNSQLELSHAFYLNFRPDFFLWKNKR